MNFDPRESPFYDDGPELAEHDLREQMRAIVRDQRISHELVQARQRRERMVPIWFASFGLAALLTVLSLAITIAGMR